MVRMNKSRKSYVASQLIYHLQKIHILLLKNALFGRLFLETITLYRDIWEYLSKKMPIFAAV